MNRGMTKPIGIMYAIVMILVIVGVDLMFFRDLPWQRLIANISIVVVFGTVYLKILR